MKTGLESLDTGAPEITYSGNEGPKSPQQMQEMQQMQMAQLEEEYDAYVDDMLEQGLEPMSMRQFLEQIAAEAQMSSNEEGIGSMMEDSRAMAADGGIMRTGVKHPDGRTGFFSAGLAAGDDISPGTSTSGGSQGGGYGKGGPPGGGDPGMTYTAPPKEYDRSKDTGPNRFELAAANAKEKARLADIEEQKKLAKIKKEQEEKEKREKDAREFFKKQDKKKEKGFFSKLLNANKTPNRTAYLNNLKKTDPVAYAEMIDELEKLSGQTVPPSMGFKTPDLVFGPPGDKDIEFGDLSTVDTLGGKFGFGEGYDNYMDNRLNPTQTGGGGGGGGGGQPATPPATPPPATPPGIPTDPVTGQYSNKYFIPGASNFYSNLPSTMFNPTTNMLTLANGGRANFAGGGIANLRQGYFLGKLVKGITKPFKKAFKGFKKIAKSPLGKMALMYFGGNLLQGNPLFGNPLKGNIINPLTKNDGGSSIADFFSGLGDKITADPFKYIAGASGVAGLYTALANKNMPDPYEDYKRRLEEERRIQPDIPVNFVDFSQPAANGGRMGFADGGDDDDEDESIRSKALGALYQKLAMGGSAGLPPVTMQTEGQDTQSFGDDESTGMPQATPTMQNQMPMRQPMMDPRMQNQMMMAQRGNPMMNRGMMSMQQPPRIMAQEGGMMDMGGMEKDYRNEGGFVPIGEYERKDDVPARLSKNEFVFTANAVRNAGGGDIDRGAEIMENMMENLEAGGKISEASQGLKGAREMFATQQRLGEVL
jgi:hypothetical protein